MNKFNKICVMGLGYIGLPTATVIAGRGMQVIGVDKNPHVIEMVNQGKPHIVEPDLEGLVSKVVSEKKLQAYDAPKKADVFIITVPTPILEDKSPDMSYVNAALEEVASHLCAGNMVIIESTSPVGTTDDACALLAKARPDLTFPHQEGEASDIRVAYCPERVLPGRILTELIHNDRIIGGVTPACALLAGAFYSQFVRGLCHQSESKVAELVKLAENASRDVNIAFANELSNVCIHHGIDANEVIQFANLHPRVNILNPGPGVGGHCIPIDPWFIVDRAPRVTPLMKMARKINDERPLKIAKTVIQKAKKLKNPTIACLGLAYKPDVDDLRESPAIEVVKALLSETESRLMVAEPHIDALPTALAGESRLEFTDALSAITRADIVVTLVNHRSFGFINKDALGEKSLFDLAGIWKRSIH
jgi:UDP-N-acetyl-D-mannosaminuronic acid dehydrogenase